jgi:hypothetical protein
MNHYMYKYVTIYIYSKTNTVTESDNAKKFVCIDSKTNYCAALFKNYPYVFYSTKAIMYL